MNRLFLIMLLMIGCCSSSRANYILSQLPDGIPVLQSLPLYCEDPLLESLKPIPIDQDLVAKLLNPCLNQVNSDVVTQIDAGGGREYFALGIIENDHGKFLLYFKGGHIIYEVYLADITDGRPYPVTLLLCDGGSDIFISIFQYDNYTNIITTAIDRYDFQKDNNEVRWCLEESRYSLEQGFGEVCNERADSNSLAPGLIKIMNETRELVPSQMNCDSLLELLPGLPVSRQFARQYLDPFINLDNFSWNLYTLERYIKYNVLGKFSLNNAEYLIYSRQTDDSFCINIARFDTKTQYPQTLQIYGTVKDNLSARFNYDQSSNTITIESIEEGFGGGVIKTVETYSIAEGFFRLTSSMYADFSVDERYGDLSKDYNWIEDW